jgi:hypothetical protein
MTDYSDLTDYKVNVLVAEKLGYKTETHEKSVFVSARHTGDNVQNVVGIYDPCNNPGDAWPVIFDNLIGLTPSLSGDIWEADKHYSYRDKNPLRAAMIVFLMIKDEE